MINENLTMTNLYKRLADIGFTKKFVRAIGLPSWWTDRLEQIEDRNKLVIYEAAGYISQRLFVDLRSLLDPNQKVKFVSSMSYSRVIKSLEKRQKGLKELQQLGVDIFSNDLPDYLEQLLLLNI